MAYTTIDDPSAFFQCTLYTGNGSNRSITNTGNSDLQPDFTWLKARSESEYNFLYDVVRGATKGLSSDLTAAEATYNDGLTAFGSDGFSLGTSNGINRNNTTYVSWNWKAGTSFTNDASSTSVGSIDSAGTVNTDSGFSIISYTGTGSNGTIAHGLGAKPNIIINKTRDTTAQMWSFYHSSLGATKHLGLDRVNAVDTGAAYYQDTEPTSTVFSVGSESATNHNGAAMIAYCFAEKPGYSKVGSYIGNGNANGSFLYTGFKPAWVLVKSSTYAGAWLIWDNKRSTSGGFNTNHYILVPSNDEAEQQGTNYAIDILSNGFKLRNTNGNVQNSGETMVYIAFAHQPVVTSEGVPATAF